MDTSDNQGEGQAQPRNIVEQIQEQQQKQEEEKKASAAGEEPEETKVEEMIDEQVTGVSTSQRQEQGAMP